MCNELKAQGTERFLKSKNGFTLAEVLLTLTIVGIIASLTIPNLIISYNQTANYTAFMTVYQTMDQATKMIVEERNFFKFTSGNEPQEALDAFATKLSTIKKCYGSPDDCWNYPVISLGGGLYNTLVTSDDSVMILSNGMKIRFLNILTNEDCDSSLYHPKGENTGCMIIFADTNGDKSPNQLGKDIIAFALHKYGIIGIGLPDTLWLYQANHRYCSTESAYDDTYSSGVGCAGKILLEGKMNY